MMSSIETQNPKSGRLLRALGFRLWEGLTLPALNPETSNLNWIPTWLTVSGLWIMGEGVLHVVQGFPFSRSGS